MHRTIFLYPFWGIKKKATMIEDEINIKTFSEVMNLVLSKVENAGLSDSSTCTLHPNIICCLARGSAFCHVDFASLGKGLSCGCHRRQEGILCLWISENWLSGCCCYCVRGGSSPPGFRGRGVWSWIWFSLLSLSPFMPFYRELELQYL